MKRNTCLNTALLAGLLAGILSFSTISVAQQHARPFLKLGLTANNFMFYHGDLERATAFYRELLGLEQVLDYGTAVMFQLADTSYITLVRGSDKKHNLKGPKPVSISLITDELEAWYRHLSRNGVPIIRVDMTAETSPWQSFVAEDPAGYSLHFMRIRTHPQTRELMAGLKTLTPVTVDIEDDSSVAVPLTIRATITSFYYKDLEAAEQLYDRGLGFKVVAGGEGSRTYHTSPSGYFRIVNADHGLHKPSQDRGQRKGVMLSLYTENVDGWFAVVRRRKDISLRTPDMVDIENLREFSFIDPGGYAVELNFFKNTKANKRLLELLAR